jgi:hypothetical protein
MDMKKILQAMDSVKTSAPIESANDMKKFMSIVTEGSTPHKVALPVQMAMQHYTKLDEKQPAKPSLLKQYMAEAAEEHEQEYYAKKVDLNMYARKIAYKIMGESVATADLNPGFKSVAGPGMQDSSPVESIDNPKDVVTMDIPLLIRILEYAREDAQTDMDLHDVTSRLIELSKSGDVLTMHDYDEIVPNQPAPEENDGF